MFITADQILAHLVGDYILQSHWMATEKTKRSLAAAVHALTYAFPFMFISTSVPALLFIVVTHFIIDRWRLARFVVRYKNWQYGPPFTPIEIYATDTGYPADTPPWLAVWLLIIADNTLHLVCNGIALKWLV